MLHKQQGPDQRRHAARAPRDVTPITTLPADNSTPAHGCSRCAQPLHCADNKTNHPRGLIVSRCMAYSSAVAANSATGHRGPINSRRTSAAPLTAGAFFVPAVRVYGGCAWETERSAGFLESRSANPRTAATPNRFAAIRGSSSTLGAIPMKHDPACNPSVPRLSTTTMAESGNSSILAAFQLGEEGSPNEAKTPRQSESRTNSPAGTSSRHCSRAVRSRAGKDPAGEASQTQTLSLAAPPWSSPAPRSSLIKRAHAHRAMALAALRSDSSLANRLRRYNHHISIARALEAYSTRQQVSHDPRTALGWIKAGKSVRINALNLSDRLRHVRALAALEAQGGEA